MTRNGDATSDRAALWQALSVAVGSANLRDDAGPDHGATILVMPATSAEVAAVMQICHTHGASIVAQGGQTGLVGGCQSQAGQVVVSLARMAQIEALYPEERVAVVQAGVPLATLQIAAAEHGLEPGIDLAARGSATIGGMVATNAGGIMAHRYGVMRHRVLGLEAVLPDGTIYSDMTRVVKNTAGYDLKHLFIGAEGTLGIVTRVAIKLEPVAQSTATVLLGLPSVAAALAAINLALRCDLGQLRAAEGLWQSYIRLTAAAQGWSDSSFPLDQPICLLLMLDGADHAHLQAGIEQIFAAMLDAFPTTTGIIAASQRQEADLWRLREDTGQLYRAHTAAPSYDVSVPLSQIDAYVARIIAGLAQIDGGIAPYVFGHLADGNLHIVLNRAGPLTAEISAAVEAVLYPGLHALGGSFSAEHGVGSKRVAAMVATIDPIKLSLMRQIKQTLDPHMIMNPGKVLPLVPTPGEKSR